MKPGQVEKVTKNSINSETFIVCNFVLLFLLDQGKNIMLNLRFVSTAGIQRKPHPS